MIRNLISARRLALSSPAMAQAPGVSDSQWSSANRSRCRGRRKQLGSTCARVRALLQPGQRARGVNGRKSC